jgi:hypothetical protein
LIQKFTLSSTVRLAILAVFSALVYALAFVQPAYLPEIYPDALPHLFHLYDPGSQVHWDLILAFFALGIAYLLACQTASEAQGRAVWVVVLGSSLAFGLVLLWMFPFDAADIFDYIIHGRMSSVYGGNPYLQMPKEFPDDPFYPYVAWKSERSPYGPVWGLLAAWASYLAGDGIVANVIAYKLISSLFLLASVCVVAVILRREAPGRALPGTLLLAWNPVVLYETWGNGHNDMVMVFWMLAAAWGIYRRHFTLVILALLASALVKYLPLLLIPAALAIVLRALPSARQRLHFFLRSGIGAAVLLALVYAPFWTGPEVLTVLQRGGLFTASIPATVYQILRPEIGRSAAAELVSRAAILFTATFALWQAWRAYHNRSRDSFPQASFNILAFYLLVTILWFQQWYTLWLLGLVPLLQSTQSRNLGILFGFSALSKQLSIGPYLFYPDYRFPQPWFEILFTLGVLGIVWIYALYTLWKPQKVDEKPSPEGMKAGPVLPGQGEGE